MILKSGNFSIKALTVDDSYDFARKQRTIVVRIDADESVDVDAIKTALQGATDVYTLEDDNGNLVQTFVGLKPDRLSKVYAAENTTVIVTFNTIQ